jgi:diguanylate cyclase (GGDEF)-like protein
MAILAAKKLLSSFDQNDIEIDSHPFKLRASIGGAIYPDDSEDAETLIQYADHAMYQVKKMGGHNIIFTH